MNDTIYIVLKDTLFSQQQIIDAYTTLVQSQQQTYNLFIIIVLAFATIMVGVNIYFSMVRAQTIIEKKILKKIHGYMQKDVHASFIKWEKRHKDKFDWLEGESARMFANINEEYKNYPLSLYWWIKALESYLKVDAKLAISLAVKQILTKISIDLKNYTPKEVYDGFTRNTGFERIPDIVESIPELLNDEKKEIKKYIDKVYKNKQDDENTKAGKEPEEKL